MRSLAIEKLKQNLSLSPIQREVLVGLLLGDGCLETQNGRTYRLKIEQSKAHQAYVNHLYHLFDGWVLTPPRVRQVMSRGHASENVTFQTVSHSALRFYAHQFYRDGRKQVPKLIHRWLTRRALSYWFMDDGSKSYRAIYLNTQQFDLESQGRLLGLLATQWSIRATLNRDKTYYRIRIAVESVGRFEELARPYVLPEMLYKFPGHDPVTTDPP